MNPMPEQVPSIGRVVHYISYGTPGGEFPAGAHRAAIITDVHNPGEPASVLSERNAAQRALRATKGRLTKTKKRIANGVCPCCNRHFVNLERHMTGKHPDYTKEQSE